MTLLRLRPMHSGVESIDVAERRVVISHLNVNLKQVMRAASQAVPENLRHLRLRFKLVLNNTVVGEIRLKTFDTATTFERL